MIIMKFCEYHQLVWLQCEETSCTYGVYTITHDSYRMYGSIGFFEQNVLMMKTNGNQMSLNILIS